MISGDCLCGGAAVKCHPNGPIRRDRGTPGLAREKLGRAGEPPSSCQFCQIRNGQHQGYMLKGHEDKGDMELDLLDQNRAARRALGYGA